MTEEENKKLIVYADVFVDEKGFYTENICIYENDYDISKQIPLINIKSVLSLCRFNIKIKIDQCEIYYKNIKVGNGIKAFISRFLVVKNNNKYINEKTVKKIFKLIKPPKIEYNKMIKIDEEFEKYVRKE